jgi:hypothetical protein
MGQIYKMAEPKLTDVGTQHPSPFAANMPFNVYCGKVVWQQLQELINQ